MHFFNSSPSSLSKSDPQIQKQSHLENVARPHRQHVRRLPRRHTDRRVAGGGGGAILRVQAGDRDEEKPTLSRPTHPHHQLLTPADSFLQLTRHATRIHTFHFSLSLSLPKKKAGYTVTLASPAGGPIPVDAASRSGDFYTPAAKRFDADEDTKAMLAASKKVVDLDPTGVDVVFVAGGHGAVADLATDQTVAAFLVAVADAGRAPVASVCHGVVALLSSDACAAHFVKGKRLTGFSDAEEVAVGKVELMGGADKTLEARLKAAGGLYTAGPDWAPHVVVDGKVVTGQNPASSAATAVAAVKAAAESLTPAVEAGGE